MNVDLTITISVILGIAAIVSPVLTALLNNRHQYKIRKLDLSQKEKNDLIQHHRKIFSEYLAGAGKCIYYADTEGLHDYGKAYFNALLISSPTVRSHMIQANKFIAGSEFEAAMPEIETVAQLIKLEDSAGIL